jgi:hypothetical protein
MFIYYNLLSAKRTLILQIDRVKFSLCSALLCARWKREK